MDILMSDINNSNQAGITISINILRDNLLSMTSSIIWKNSNKANLNEDSNNHYLAELFTVAHKGLLNFDIIKSFPRSVLYNSGVSSDLIEMYASDKYSIPTNIRSILVDEYNYGLTNIDPVTGRYSYIDKRTNTSVLLYEEKNNYYRMLMGLPNYGDVRNIYNTDPRWPTDIPIHNLPLLDLLEMERDGVLDTIIANNPQDDYLKYLASKRIDYYRSRTAKRFDILYYNESTSDLLNSTFLDTYKKCAYLTNNVYYSKVLSRSNTLYENFLAMSIVFMTIQNIFHKFLSSDVTRDFYDVESLKVVYDAYNVPFYADIPLDYHRKIVKNMNRLLSYKGSANVFFDLFDIFDLAIMEIYSYYITKTHKLDNNSKPIFDIKTDDEGNPVYDENGRPVMKDSVYDINFARAKLLTDPALAISDKSNTIPYNQITDPDPYWINDADLQAKLNSEYFNFTESKYLGIQTIFDLMKITFENAYIFRMITDNKDITSKFTSRWVEGNIEVNIYTMFIYLAALYCRFYGYDGIISNKIPAIMDTYGYNFEEVSSILNNKILTDPILSKDSRLKLTMALISLTTSDSINDSYENIIELRQYISDKMTGASTKDEFFTYKSLYDTLMISREVTKVYTDPRTGNVYETFIEILSYEGPSLAQRYLQLEDNDIAREVGYVISFLEKAIPDLRYLSYSIGINTSSMIDALFRILDFFKSAKAELVDYEVTYMITMRGINFFKMMDTIDFIHTASSLETKSSYNDIIDSMSYFQKIIDDHLLMKEGIISQYISYEYSDIQLYTDFLTQISYILDEKLSSEIWYNDILENANNTAAIRSLMLMTDGEATLVDFELKGHRYSGLIEDKMNMFDSIKFDTPLLKIMSKMSIIDRLYGIYSTQSSSKNFSSLGDYYDSIKGNGLLNIFKDSFNSISDNLYSNTNNGKYETLMSIYDDMNNAIHILDEKLYSDMPMSDILTIDALQIIIESAGLYSDQIKNPIIKSNSNIISSYEDIMKDNTQISALENTLSSNVDTMYSSSNNRSYYDASFSFNDSLQLLSEEYFP